MKDARSRSGAAGLPPSRPLRRFTTGSTIGDSRPGGCVVGGVTAGGGVVVGALVGAVVGVADGEVGPGAEVDGALPGAGRLAVVVGGRGRRDRRRRGRGELERGPVDGGGQAVAEHLERGDVLVEGDERPRCAVGPEGGGAGEAVGERAAPAEEGDHRAEEHLPRLAQLVDVGLLERGLRVERRDQRAVEADRPSVAHDLAGEAAAEALERVDVGHHVAEEPLVPGVLAGEHERARGTGDDPDGGQRRPAAARARRWTARRSRSRTCRRTRPPARTATG